MRKDDVTADLPGMPKRPGRPPTGRALTPAERQRAYRERKAAQGKAQLPPVFVDADVLEALAGYVDRQNKDRVEQPMTLGDAVGNILRDRLLRKR